MHIKLEIKRIKSDKIKINTYIQLWRLHCLRAFLKKSINVWFRSSLIVWQKNKMIQHQEWKKNGSILWKNNEILINPQKSNTSLACFTRAINKTMSIRSRLENHLNYVAFNFFLSVAIFENLKNLTRLTTRDKSTSGRCKEERLHIKICDICVCLFHLSFAV